MKNISYEINNQEYTAELSGKNRPNYTVFEIQVEMDNGSIPHFLAMLKYMEQLGGQGSSRMVSFYADGDGAFRPRFNWSDKLPSDAKPIKDNDGDRTYDAG